MSKIRCKQVRARLSAYLDNELLDSREADIAGHLAVCEGCRDFRRELNLPREYLRKLKEAPAVDFKPDMNRVFMMPHFSPVWVLAKRGALILLLIAVGAGIYVAAAHKPLPKFTQKTAGALSKDIDFLKKLVFSSRKRIQGLSEGGETVLDTVYPTLVKAGQNFWISVEGRASLYKGENSVTVNLRGGEVYFVSDDIFPCQKTVNVAGFQITSFKTAFFIRADGPLADIQLLDGQLTVKYRGANNLISARLLSGEGATARAAGENTTLNAYKLSPSQRSLLLARSNRIKETGRWFERNPRQRYFKSGEVRIEYWKGE